MRIDGSSLNPFRPLQASGSQLGGGTGPFAASGAGLETGRSGAFKLKIASYTPPPPPGLEGVFEHPGQLGNARTMPELVEKLGKPESTTDAFVLEMVRRMQGQTNEQGESKDTGRIANALKNAVEWIRGQHDEATATSAMAMVLGSTGEGASEATVAGGLLGALKFIDRVHGMAAGDAAMAHFNGELNDAINEYFDNGLNEEFLAVNVSGAHGLSAGSLASRFSRQATGAEADAVDEQSLTEKLLKDLTKELEDAADPEALSKAKARKAMEAYGFVAAPAPELVSMST